jgi:hypothetical protein
VSSRHSAEMTRVRLALQITILLSAGKHRHSASPWIPKPVAAWSECCNQVEMSFSRPDRNVTRFVLACVSRRRAQAEPRCCDGDRGSSAFALAYAHSEHTPSVRYWS